MELNQTLRAFVCRTVRYETGNSNQFKVFALQTREMYLTFPRDFYDNLLTVIHQRTSMLCQRRRFCRVRVLVHDLSPIFELFLVSMLYGVVQSSEKG